MPRTIRCASLLRSSAALAHWLTEAGLDKLAGVKDEALRLVRTVRYANTYYLGVEDGEAPITIETVWAIEAALNRFLLVSEAFGDRASMATEADCARWDAICWKRWLRSVQ